MALENLATPDRSRTAHEYALKALRAAVLDGTLARGSRLVQGALADRLGVSTTPVREALRDLAGEGLVMFDAHRGAFVRNLDIAEVRELYELRMTLEPLMVRRVTPRITADQLVRAEALHNAMAGLDDLHAWAELNRDLHAVLAEPDRGSRLAVVLDGLRDAAEPYVALSLAARPQQVREADVEHAQLIDLYRQGDDDHIVEVTLHHFQATLDAIEQVHLEKGL